MSFTDRDLLALADILRAAARAEILPRFRRLRPQDIRTKSSKQDLVTEADVAAEAHIEAACARAFPGVQVVGEEACAADLSLMNALTAAPFAITIDPIDGTSNFAAGLPLFGVMAAMIENGSTVASVILDPICDSYSASRQGFGATEHAADGSSTALRVAPPVPLSEMTGMISWRFMDPATRGNVLRNITKVAQTWDHKCAAHEYRLLIAGQSDFVMFNRLMPWDHLPGVLLHAEAGGYSARFDGSPYRPGDTAGGLICASNEVAWHALSGGLLL